MLPVTYHTSAYCAVREAKPATLALGKCSPPASHNGKPPRLANSPFKALVAVIGNAGSDGGLAASGDHDVLRSWEKSPGEKTWGEGDESQLRRKLRRKERRDAIRLVILEWRYRDD